MSENPNFPNDEVGQKCRPQFYWVIRLRSVGVRESSGETARRDRKAPETPDLS